MIKINRLSDYALVLLAKLADLGGETSTTTVLSEQTNIALPVVRKLMQQLRDAGLVEAKQGHQGGYLLAQPLSKIHLYAVLTAIQGELALTQCSLQAEHACKVQCHHPFGQHWQSINQAMQAMLTNISLADMMQSQPLPISLVETPSQLMEPAHGG